MCQYFITLLKRLVNNVYRPCNSKIIQSHHHSFHLSTVVSITGTILPFIWWSVTEQLAFSGRSVGKKPTCNAGNLGLISGSGRFPWRRKWQSTPVFLPGKSHGQRSLASYTPWGHKKSWTRICNWTTKQNKHSLTQDLVQKALKAALEN